MQLGCVPSRFGRCGSGHSEQPVLEKASVDSSVHPTHEATSAAAGACRTGGGMLQLEYEGRAAGEAGPDLRPTGGALGTCWFRSRSAPDADGAMSSSMKTFVTPTRRYNLVSVSTRGRVRCVEPRPEPAEQRHR